MVQAIREGTLTAHDILDRVGEVGQAKKKAELQSLGEFSSDQGIQARAAVRQQQIAQSNLATTQAQVASPLVPTEAQLRQQQLDDAIYEQRYGEPGAVSLYRELSPNPILKSDGTEDKDSMAHAGAKYLQRMKMLQWSLPMLKPDPALSKEEIRNGRRVMVMRNAFGNPIPDIHDVLSVYGNVDSMAPAKKGKGEETTAPVISPSVQPATRPVVEPSIPSIGQPTPEIDLGPDPGEFQRAKDLRTEMEGRQHLKLFDEAKASNEQVLGAEQYLQKLTPGKPIGSPENDAAQRTSDKTLLVFDDKLVRAYYKLLHPQTRVTEADLEEKIQGGFNSIDVPSKEIRDRINKFTKTGVLDPGARRSLIGEAKKAFAEDRAAVVDTINSYKDQEQNVWKLPPGTVVGKEYQDILKSAQEYKSGQESATPATPATGASPQIRTVPGKGQMISADGGKTWNWLK
jgi:hypothetical protein